MQENFFTYLELNQNEIATIRAILNLALAQEQPVLRDQLTQAEGYYYRTMEHLSWAETFLDVACAEANNIYVKQSVSTARERDILIDAHVVEQRRFRDLVKGASLAIEQRVILGQSLLKSLDKETQRHQV